MACDCAAATLLGNKKYLPYSKQLPAWKKATKMQSSIVSSCTFHSCRCRGCLILTISAALILRGIKLPLSMVISQLVHASQWTLVR